MEEINSLVSLKVNTNSAKELGSFKIIHSEPASADATLNTNTKNITSEYKIAYYEARQTNRHKSPSGVWKYFALATKESSPCDPPDDRILCMLCYSQGRVHVYKSKTSSSNLWKHLNRKHDIEIPTEKMFTISSGKFDGFEFSADTEDSHDANSTDYQLSAVDVYENDEIVFNADDFDGGDCFEEDPMEEKSHDVKSAIKYEIETCPTSTVFRDIGSAIIEEVSKRPILYETQSSRWPSKRATKEKSWAEVYDALGEIISVDRIQKIWKNIRDRYRKIRSAEKDGVDASSKKYKYYDQLTFLNDVGAIDHNSDTSLDEPLEKKQRAEDYSFLIEQNDVLLSTPDELNQCEQNYIDEVIVPNTCAVISNNPPLDTAPYPLDISQNSIEDQSTKQSTSSSSAPHNIEQMDEFDLFGKLIAKKLRSAPKDRVDLIEIKIMQVIHENS